MRVIWAYADWSEDGNFELKNLIQQITFKVGLLQWVINYPQCTRVLYCDKSVLNFLKELEIEVFFDEINLVNFQEELREKRSCGFFALPKIYAMASECREPYIVQDTDLVISDSFLDNLDKKKLTGYVGDHRYTIGKSFKSLEDSVKALSTDKIWKYFSNWTKATNGCIVYVPDAAKGCIAAHACLSILAGKDSYIGKSNNWILYEESLLRNILETVFGYSMKSCEDQVLEIRETSGDLNSVFSRIQNFLKRDCKEQVIKRKV